MEKPDTLIALFMEEDRMLRQLLALCPVEDREVRGSGGTLSLKETLGHLAFWDSFAVRFFEDKLAGTDNASLPRDFEKQSREELKRLRKLPFDDVLESYQNSTRELIAFLQNRWHELSAKQRLDFHVPLKHRRHHRLLLSRALASEGSGPEPDARTAQA
jgi:hypothetical protein